VEIEEAARAVRARHDRDPDFWARDLRAETRAHRAFVQAVSLYFVTVAAQLICEVVLFPLRLVLAVYALLREALTPTR